MASTPDRQFDSGATRDAVVDKLDFDGFLSPLVIKRYGAYMHRNRFRPSGDVRDSDNWQLGIPIPVYRKSLLRHVIDVWDESRSHQLGHANEEELCAIIFNASGMLHEQLKAKKEQRTGEETL